MFVLLCCAPADTSGESKPEVTEVASNEYSYPSSGNKELACTGPNVACIYGVLPLAMYNNYNYVCVHLATWQCECYYLYIGPYQEHDAWGTNYV